MGVCGSVLDSTMDGILNCKQAGCKTQWYHLQCMEFEQEPRNWVCAACEASGWGEMVMKMMSYCSI
ncbi:hypothetical protein L208DRAFT_1244161 [Tricholoma matsutake]|nr:hypothetical protein L208DRAFT_1244161 [Tricholoma matsutake 945]